MSTYKAGEKELTRQVDTIMQQEGVDVHLLIRDDGSGEETRSLLRSLQESHPGRITVLFKKNRGFIKSFHSLLHAQEAAGYDYYAFSDQDDVWKAKKLLSCIEVIEQAGVRGPALCQCRSLCVDEQLRPVAAREPQGLRPRDLKTAIARDWIGRGCAMVWNEDLMALLRRYRPQNPYISHDYWVGLVAYLCGSFLFCDEPLLLHIRYSGSASFDGRRTAGRLHRIHEILHTDHAYQNVAGDLLRGYSDLLSPADTAFLLCLRNSRKNASCRLQLALDPDLKKESPAATALLKLAILAGRY